MGAKTRPTAVVVAAAVAALLILVQYLESGAGRFQHAFVSGLSFDTAMIVRGNVRHSLGLVPRADSGIVLVEYDNDSEQAMREYPTMWHFYSALVDAIAAAKPRALFIDYLFHYNSFLEGWGVELEGISASLEKEGKLSDDARVRAEALQSRLTAARGFAKSLASLPTYLPASCFETIQGGVYPETPEANARLAKLGAFDAPKGAVRGVAVNRLEYPNDRFLDAATGLVEVCEHTDADGVSRRDIAVLDLDRGNGRHVQIPNASIVLASIALGVPRERVTTVEGGMQIGDHFIPTDEEGYVPFALTGGRDEFRSRGISGAPVQFSAAKILAGKVPARFLENKVVLFGEANGASLDQKHTSFSRFSTWSPKTPGVEVLAAQADAMTRDPFPLQIPRWVSRYGFVLSLAWFAFGAWLGSTVSPSLRTLPLLLLGLTSFLIPAWTLFIFRGIWIDPVFPTLVGSVAFVFGAGERYVRTQRERGFIESAFGKFVSPAIVEEIISSGKTPDFSGEEKEMTVLFADLRGFTSKSEQISAKEMVDLLNGHLDAMTRVIHAHGGTLDKFIGDCVMAFWGSPKGDPDHALHACQAGLEMLETVARDNERRIREGKFELAIGVGINTGTMIVGKMGAHDLLNYTVIGDAVNLASRLEGLTKDAGYGALIGEETARQIGARIPNDALGNLKVKGKALAVPVWGLSATKKADRDLEKAAGH